MLLKKEFKAEMNKWLYQDHIINKNTNPLNSDLLFWKGQRERANKHQDFLGKLLQIVYFFSISLWIKHWFRRFRVDLGKTFEKLSSDLIYSPAWEAPHFIITIMNLFTELHIHSCCGFLIEMTLVLCFPQLQFQTSPVLEKISHLSKYYLSATDTHTERAKCLNILTLSIHTAFWWDTLRRKQAYRDSFD